MGAGINEVVGGREGIVLGDADLQLIGTWVISDRLLPNGRTLAQMYAERHDISQEERDVAGRIADARLSLLRIDAVTPGRCIDIYDLTRHEATCISSHDVSRSVRPGHVIVGRIMAGPPAPTLWGPVAFLDRRSSRELSELLTARVRALGLEDDPGALSAAVRAASREVTALLALAFREHPSARLAA